MLSMPYQFFRRKAIWLVIFYCFFLPRPTLVWSDPSDLWPQAQNFSADFTQGRIDPLFQKPPITKGHLRTQHEEPKTIWMDIKKPKPVKIEIRGDQIWVNGNLQTFSTQQHFMEAFLNTPDPSQIQTDATRQYLPLWETVKPYARDFKPKGTWSVWRRANAYDLFLHQEKPNAVPNFLIWTDALNMTHWLHLSKITILEKADS